MWNFARTADSFFRLCILYEHIPIYPFNDQERKDDVANQIRQQRGTRDGIVFVGVAQEKAHAYQGKKIDGQFQFTRDKIVSMPTGIRIHIAPESLSTCPGICISLPATLTT